MAQLSREDVVEKFKEAFKRDKYIIRTKQYDYGAQLKLEVENSKTDKRGGIYLQGPAEERIHKLKTIMEQIQRIREVIG